MKNNNIRKKAVIILAILFFGIIMGANVGSVKVLNENIRKCGPGGNFVEDARAPFNIEPTQSDVCNSGGSPANITVRETTTILPGHILGIMW